LPDGSDNVRLRVAPVIFRHHLDPAETVYVSAFNTTASLAFRNDLAVATVAAAVPAPLYEFWGIGDQWTQDFFETSIMSMPAVGGAHTIHLNFRSANYTAGGGLRAAGRVVFTDLRGPDVAGAVQLDPAHPDFMDTLNSFGNLETIPPYDNGTTSWPLGRVIRGGTPTFYPDESFDEMIDAQGMQSVIHFDTEWLWVAHIDETLSFLPAASPRGWLVLAADVVTAWNELVDAEFYGYGNTPMFVGKLDPWGTPAEITITEVLSDPDLANANAWAAAEVAGQLDQLTLETGISPSEILSAPFLMWEYSGYLVAYVPGLVNGVVLPNMIYAPPDPHGPVISSIDLFKGLLEDELVTAGYTAAWVEDRDLYHILGGEVHCGSNATHAIPDQPWWETMP
jgi:protein-arginine deiminase